MKQKVDYSIVIPAFNEEESITELYSEIVAVMENLSRNFEIIFIDDGSFDGTLQKMQTLQTQDNRVQIIRFTRNFGKSAAYTAGFDVAHGEIIITLDADLQDDPREIPKLLMVLKSGYDLVVGWKQNRLANEPTKTIPSRIFNFIVRLIFGLKLHDSNSGFRVLRRAVATSLELYGDLYRFIPELAHLKGFRVTECGVQHRQRKYGQSKYGITRFWTSIFDLLTIRFITAFIHKPLHFFGAMGLLPLIIGFLLEIYVLIRKIMGDTFQTHLAALIIGVMLILVGLQLLATGLLGEMIAIPKQSPRYIIQEMRNTIKGESETSTIAK